MRVAGYFQGVMGTGEHARQLLAALRTQSIPASLMTLRPEGSPEDKSLVPASDEDGLGDPFRDFSLLCVNADMVPQVALQLGPAFFSGRYTIGFWAWEVSVFPSHSATGFEHVDEVWVGSRHVRDAVAPFATTPVMIIPQPISLPDGAERSSPPAGLPDGFRFLFAFDYLSVFERKNPIGAIKAFTRAFAPGSGAHLIIKSLNHDFEPAAHERLKAAIAEHSDIHLIDQRLSREERDGLMNGVDCYVSLHRAEGFGYTLAESMWLGKPVIATGYSGNLDFMTSENSFLVDHRLVPIGPGNGPYPPEGEWAEPDTDHAARLMRKVFENREEAVRRGDRAAQDIRRTHSPEAAGHVMRKRLEVLAEAHRRRQPALREPSNWSTGRVARLISSGPVAPRRSRFGPPQRAARRALLRVLKPATVHQRLVDQELLDALGALNARVQRLEDELGLGASSQRSGRS